MSLKVEFVQAPLHGTYKDGQYFPNLGAPSGLYGIEHGTVGYGMLHLATVVAKDHDVRIWSLSAAALGNKLYSSLKKIVVADVVGIQMNWGIESRGVLTLAEYLKSKNPDICIVIGGTHASLFANEIVKFPCVDCVIRGESEIIFPEFLKRLSTVSIPKLPGIVTADFDGGYAPFFDDINSIPPYDPSLLATPVERSIPWAVNRVRGTCPWRCSYCIGGHICRVSNRKRMQYHSPEWVIQQLEILIEYGAKCVMFQDQGWAATIQGNNKVGSYLNNLLEKMNSWRGAWNIRYGIRDTAPPILNLDTLSLMSKVNVTFIDYGCESGSLRVLHQMGRKYTISQMYNTIKDTYDLGMIPGTWWTAGHPGETDKDIVQTIDAIERTVEYGGVPMWITPLIVLPGTPIAENPEKYDIIDMWNGFSKYQILADIDQQRISRNDYEHLISHETKTQSRHNIIYGTSKIRQRIQELRPTVLAKIADRFFEEHRSFPHEFVEQLGATENHAAGSYF